MPTCCLVLAVAAAVAQPSAHPSSAPSTSQPTGTPSALPSTAPTAPPSQPSSSSDSAGVSAAGWVGIGTAAVVAAVALWYVLYKRSKGRAMPPQGAAPVQRDLADVGATDRQEVCASESVLCVESVSEWTYDTLDGTDQTTESRRMRIAGARVDTAAARIGNFRSARRSGASPRAPPTAWAGGREMAL
eukprot:TRINITY_DN22588_c0_g1_i1.p3 TRINITY_DN22588_c0_g1~~TRINITY_DN22588_c0_g1_i1.p3  ORF type:complete len:188 (+),score=37.09 TRINITY_DN22588_c0_g1_i1:93-656(+)